MSVQHKDLSSRRWGQLSLCEQMANIGSEVERALNWQNKNNFEYSRRASNRALELIDLSLDSILNHNSIREVARLREVFVDYFYGDNQFLSTEESWRKYFMAFTYAARRLC